MTEMAIMTIHGIHDSNNFFSEIKRPMTSGLIMYHLGYSPLHICDDNRSSLTQVMARSNLIPNAFIWKTIEKLF